MTVSIPLRSSTLLLTLLLFASCKSSVSATNESGLPDLSQGSSLLQHGGEVVDQVEDQFYALIYRFKELRSDAERKVLEAELNNALFEIAQERDKLVAELAPEEAELLRQYALARLNAAGAELVAKSNELYAPQASGQEPQATQGCTSCVRLWGGFCHRRCCSNAANVGDQAWQGTGLAEGEWTCEDCKQTCSSCR